MKSYTNNNLREVVCSFNFLDEDDITWDSGYFGQYYDKIKDLGFTQRNERKGIKIQFNGNADQITEGGAASVEEVGSEMIFRNPEKGLAIIMGDRKISFHIVTGYIDWYTFYETFMRPCLNLYLEVGIYKRPDFCQVIYLNEFTFDPWESLADFFTIVTPPLSDVGIEGSVLVQKNYIANQLGLLVKLNANPTPDEKKFVIVECGATSLPYPENQELGLLALANKTKEPIRDFFENIITDKLRSIL